MAKIHELRYELLPHPAYSPDLAPCDYYLFPNLKKWLGVSTCTEEVQRPHMAVCHEPLQAALRLPVASSICQLNNGDGVTHDLSVVKDVRWFKLFAKHSLLLCIKRTQWQGRRLIRPESVRTQKARHVSRKPGGREPHLTHTVK
ncbi:hypothetical protein EVAR_14747_1 [Eumeta japonica]|uniref:Histone-lysine N-methyltransferase SETMAR n=1 Tax=Eumeta variegata TaxID=151549 RepID=A0A4C1TWU9_EUMVA|nr:hypothetical protein EVAR_14747_1 [Eumeta japonica]